MLRMSFYAIDEIRNEGSKFGYSYSYNEINKHLKKYSYDNEFMQVDLDSFESKVKLRYGEPHGYFYPHQYKIQMTQSETTLISPELVEKSKGYDEFWTANKFGAESFIRSGVPEKKVHVFEHGVDSSIWTPKKRNLNGPIRFLHVDSGSPRKRGTLALEAFKIAFKNDPNYQITFKYSHTKDTKVNWFDKKVLEQHGTWVDNARHIIETMSLEELVSLYHFHDILIYPSEGEGFGMIPLQALATGMPVISTGVWCSYEKYLNGNVIDSKIGVSDIVENYTRYGEMVLPDIDSMVYLMKKTAEDFLNQSEIFYNQIDDVVSEYNWQNKTNDMIDSLIKRIGIDMFR